MLSRLRGGTSAQGHSGASSPRLRLATKYPPSPEIRRVSPRRRPVGNLQPLRQKCSPCLTPALPRLRRQKARILYFTQLLNIHEPTLAACNAFHKVNRVPGTSEVVPVERRPFLLRRIDNPARDVSNPQIFNSFTSAVPALRRELTAGAFCG